LVVVAVTSVGDVVTPPDGALTPALIPGESWMQYTVVASCVPVFIPADGGDIS